MRAHGLVHTLCAATLATVLATVLGLGLGVMVLPTAGAAGAAGAAGVPGTSGTHGNGHDLTFMTYNLYLGSSLDPALAVGQLPPAEQPAAFVAAVAQIYGTAVFTDFPTRAGAVADAVAADEPDVIGLQEVTKWVASATTPGSAADPPGFDFLQILTTELTARGLHYEVAGISHNADIGPAPLVAPAYGCTTVTPVPDCVVTLQDRDVILVNADTPGLRWGGTRTGTYAAQQTVPLPGGPPVSFGRGWVTIDATYRGRRVHVADTHLEVSGFAAVQEAQAAEFLAGPARGRGADVALGDFNSAADGSTTASYDLLTCRMRDAWALTHDDPGYSSGQNETLTNPVSTLDERIDLVLVHGRARPVEAHLVGAVPFRAQTLPPRPIWASDHAGVVATVRLGQHRR